jgi:hypothetical protein
MESIRRAAEVEQVSVGQWVRKALKEAQARVPGKTAEVKLKAIRAAAEHSFPVAGIELMLSEIERGYQD